MSLNPVERQTTSQELQANFTRSGLSCAQVAVALQTTPERIKAVLALKVQRIEDPWILRNYLAQQLVQQGITPVPYHHLVGDAADYWFLNQARINRERL
ncbi:DUF2316 domain-containing protein [Lactobacillus sp. CBA3605]|uniref:DUF2316 family protein n=1 Tax=Lactobacillus sp. CBA3605 TaxID=2099788 RepID=UPI000CFBAEA7|nr:DUF2316 family protein [Lactobacillus sp. CBA3605]AVK60574.1 DUF2316 domain-containing protein [Lactobacillus sp. CBA3605]